MDSRSATAFWASVTIVVIGAFTLIVAPARMTAVRAARFSAPRVAPAAPTPTPVPLALRSPECRQMDNPGGRLAWNPSPNPGPWPTDATVRLARFGVTAPIIRVGIDESGAMVVPRTAYQVAWLDQGGFPGRTQNVVMAGHVGWNGVAGSFAHIAELKPGDVVSVKAGAKSWTYKVKWECAFSRDSAFATEIMGYTTVPSVTLITCGGDFDVFAGTHTKRVAVRAELVPPPPAPPKAA